jgi:hypothetical protein
MRTKDALVGEWFARLDFLVAAGTAQNDHLLFRRKNSKGRQK